MVVILFHNTDLRPTTAAAAAATAKIGVYPETSNLTVKVYFCFLGGVLVKTWKSIHHGPVSELELNGSGLTLASSGTDGVIRLWDLANHSCTHALRGAQGVIRYINGVGDSTG